MPKNAISEKDSYNLDKTPDIIFGLLHLGPNNKKLQSY